MSVQDDKLNQTGAAAFADLAERRAQSLLTRSEQRNSAQQKPDSSEPAARVIPARFRTLFISEQRPDWVGFALRLDAVGCTGPRLEWVSTSEEALRLLRNDSYDCLLIEVDSSTRVSRQELLQAIRMSGCDEPIVLVSAVPDDQITLAACAFDTELLTSPALWDSPALLSLLERALQKHRQQQDYRQLQIENHRRLVRERDEAERLLNQQRSMVEELQSLVYPGALESQQVQKPAEAKQEQSVIQESVDSGQVPAEIPEYYHELLRTYVIMGSGSLKEEIVQIAELLSAARLSSRQVLEFHLECVEIIVRGLGNRSTRHVMARADLLALEMMVHLGECYQQKLAE